MSKGLEEKLESELRQGTKFEHDVAACVIANRSQSG
jgi:hypothetical protein